MPHIALNQTISGLRLGGLLAALLLHAAPASAQQATTDGEAATGDSWRFEGSAAPLAIEARMRTGEISIDGRLDEAAWQDATVATGFVQAEPDEGRPATFDTEVRLLIDDDAIYVSARMWDAHPDSIGQQLSRRDEQGGHFDWFGFSLSPNHDLRTGYHFRVSAAGVQGDRYLFDDSWEDITWNAVWASAATTDSLGWSAEIRVPLSQIRYLSSGGPRTWGVNFTRRRSSSAEMTHYSFMSRRKEEGQVSKFATLENVRVPASVRRMEARPYALTSFHSGPAEAGDPFFDGTATGLRVGSDFRLGLGSAFTLDATVNPDFGQVDADPAQINLSAFESFFDERRPFFVEDAQIFDFRLSGGQNSLFYSRRIGRAPHGDAPDDADFARITDAATILGAAKITGRTAGGLAMGGLAAVTQAETGEAFYSATGETVPFAAEPRTEYGVVTAQQDLRQGQSQVGVIATALNRELPEDGVFDDLTAQAFNAGVRFEHMWSDRGWRLNGFLAGSHVRGGTEALIRVQRASNHYVQRPDASRVSVDSSATSMTGAEWRLQLDRQNTRHWTGGVWLGETTPGFEINDLGFANTRERFDAGFRIGYRETQPGKVFREYNINLHNFHNFSHEALDDAGSWDSWRRAYTNGMFNLGARATLLSYNGADMNVTWQPDQYSRTQTRGGPVMIQPGSVGFRAGFDTDRRQPLQLNGGFGLSRGSQGSGNDLSFDFNVNYRPSSRLVLQLQPRFSIETDKSQYVGSTSTLDYQPTFGRRYLFGELERKTISLETRVDYSFSPTLSFQLYAQPLLSSGDYVGYKQLAAPGTWSFRAFREGQARTVGGSTVCAGGDICRDADGDQHVDFDLDGVSDYSFADKDFNVRSLIGNAVLRWEYRPGSTLFLVWQRQQSMDASLGSFDFDRDVDALLGAPADNRFIVKLNYWVGL